MFILISHNDVGGFISLKNKNFMATTFSKFRPSLAQETSIRRIWYGVATAHDLEGHDGIIEDNLYQSIFASHFGHQAIIFLWTFGNLF